MQGRWSLAAPLFAPEPDPRERRRTPPELLLERGMIKHLRDGLNVAYGSVTCRPVADALGYPYVDPRTVLAARH